MQRQFGGDPRIVGRTVLLNRRSFEIVYGVMAFMVSQRSNEIGVRLVLGAQRGNEEAGIVIYDQAEQP